MVKLEEKKIYGEQTKLAQERQKIKKILASKIKLKKLIRSELIADKKIIAINVGPL
ncbi:MAG: hypothetical protein AB8W34_00635 [Coxiella endosymbiont of Dermacentor silvarum]